jgi:hypothetical protein
VTPACRHLDIFLEEILSRSQAHVERRRLPSTNGDGRRVGFEAVSLNLDAMCSLGHLDDEAILALRSVPSLAVNKQARAFRLDPNRQRAKRRRIPARTCLIRRRRRQSATELSAAGRRWRSRLVRPGLIRVALNASWRSWGGRPRLGNITGHQRLHLVFDFERRPRRRVDGLMDRPEPISIQRDLVIARTDGQPLKDAVEVVDDARVVAVDVDLGLLGVTSRRTALPGSKR